MNSDDPDGWSFIWGSGVIRPTATPGIGECTTTGGFAFLLSFMFLLICCFGTLALLLRVRLRGNSCLGVCCAYILFVLLVDTIHAYKSMFIFTHAIKQLRQFNSDAGEE